MESDKIGGILDKVQNHASTLGGAFGFFAHPLAVKDEQSIPYFLQNAIVHWKPKDPLWILQKEFDMEAAHPGAYPIMGNAMTAIGGWVLQLLGPTIDGRLGQLGAIVKKLGVGMLVGNIASGFFWLPQFNPSGGVSVSTASMNPQASFAVGGPGTPHTTNQNGFKQVLKAESVVA